MCHTGHPRFIAPEYHSLASDDTFPVWIERVDGKNGILKAVLKFCGRDDDSGHTVLWENGDNGPRMVQMPNTRKGDKGERALCLARLGGGTSMNQGTTALVQIHDSLDHDMVQFGETRLTARESDATLRISVHRIRRDSTETPNTHSIDKEKVETLNTHATDKEKAETRKTHATDKEKKKTPNEPSRRPLNVTIVHSGGNALSSIDFQVCGGGDTLAQQEPEPVQRDHCTALAGE
ncbi:hypothetical protein SARC_04150 [Sphaeroforma arctica JP610]|uniref:Uncharacterized protein n=1 Tax=Sphaeroforma arctica JP610 TaxID=667725 RepID=A0A0L0G3J2_9EUKA|nr:hypothetical protein SARC_04150 [Sphaeroforma arctica JP610]KNC83615.1 hypothetical protein SARC_04150 [Sphaeroforma arctica JP610]|eukprot:XP_014157517.1 hypothetical protein SARC_04150 [Sphaeroforma arctica JP610]